MNPDQQKPSPPSSPLKGPHSPSKKYQEDAPLAPPPRPRRPSSPTGRASPQARNRAAMKFSRSPVVFPITSLKSSVDTALAQQSKLDRRDSPSFLSPPSKDEEVFSSDSDCSSDMEQFSYGCPTCGSEEISDYVVCVICGNIGCIHCVTHNMCISCEKVRDNSSPSTPLSSFSTPSPCPSPFPSPSSSPPPLPPPSSSSPPPLPPPSSSSSSSSSPPSPSSNNYASFSVCSSPVPPPLSIFSSSSPPTSSSPPPATLPPPLPGSVSPLLKKKTILSAPVEHPSSPLVSTKKVTKDEEEEEEKNESVNRDLTAQRIKEQLDLIESDKMQLESLKKQMEAVESTMMMREVEISKLEWQRECCRFVQEFKIGHYKDYIGTRNWGLTEYESLKRVIDSLKSLFVEERVDSQDHANVVEICKSTHTTLTSLSARAFDIAVVCPKFDVCPGLKGNGWRSYLDVLESSLQAVLYDLKSKDKKWWRSIQRDTTSVTYIRTLENITNLAINVILKNSPMGSLFPVSNFEGMLNDLLALPLEVFYGKFFGAHFTKGLRRILGFLLVAMASFGDGVKSGEGIKGRFRALMTSTKYLAFNKKAALRTVQLFASGDINFLKAFWGLQETVAFVEIDTAIRTPTPSVNIVFKIKVEPLSVPSAAGEGEAVPLDVIAMFLAHNEQHHSPKHYFQQEARNKREAALRQNRSRQTKVSATCQVEFDKDLKRGVFQHVRVRLLSYVRHVGQLHSHGYDKISKGGSRDVIESTPTMDSFRSKPRFDSTAPPNESGKAESTEPLASGLLIHIHGGGFVAHTSKAHLNYLRDYAKAIQAPILSLDYSLAPEHPFPQPLYEAFFAYCWAITHPDLLGTKAERVVLTGDSAGANLVIAVTMLAIREGIRVPDVIVPVYPALLAKRIPSPARLLSVIDPLLGTGVLLQCLYCYSAGLEVSDEYMSPVLCSDEMFKKFPPVQLVTGKLDPLLDDSLLFASHLKRNKMPTILHLLEGLPHGFLGFNRVCREATSGTKVVIEHLRYAFNLRAEPPFRSISELETMSEQGKINELRIDFFDGKVGPLVVLGVFQTRELVTREALATDSWTLEDMKLLGYVQLSGKKYLVSHRISVDDRSFLFRVYQKRVKKGSKQEFCVMGFKNMKTGRFISQTHLTDTLTTANRMWDLESVDVRSPRWRIFKNGLTESTPFRLGKDKKTLGLGESEPLFFKMIDVISAAHSKVAW